MGLWNQTLWRHTKGWKQLRVQRDAAQRTWLLEDISYSVALRHDIHGTEQTQSNVGSEGKKPQKNCLEMRSTCLDYPTQKRSFRNDLQGTHSAAAAATSIFKAINQWNMKTGEKSMKVNAHLEPNCLLMPGSKSLAQRGWGEAPQQSALAHAEGNRSLCLLYMKIFWVKVHNKLIVAEPNHVLSPNP